MKTSCWMAACAALMLSGCTKASFNESAIASDAKSTSKVRPLNNRNGSQNIVDPQVNEQLERGASVGIPFFSEETVVVKTGTWVTIRFSIQEIISLGTCLPELTEEARQEMIDFTNNFVAESGLRITFDDKEIDVAEFFRTEYISTFTNSFGNCQFVNPFRYYVNPQSKGDHVLKTWLDGVEYSRIISYQ